MPGMTQFDFRRLRRSPARPGRPVTCLLYTSDAADDRAGVDGTTVTVPLHRVGGNRRASTETAETVTGRPGRAGLRRRRRKSNWVIPGMSGRIRPDQTGSDRIKPDQVKPTWNMPKLNLLTVTEYLTTVVTRR